MTNREKRSQLTVSKSTPGDFRFHSVYSGYCRIYYELGRGEDSKIFCLQDDGRQGINFYRCTGEFEPDDTVGLPFEFKFLPVPDNPDDDRWLQRIIDWMRQN